MQWVDDYGSTCKKRVGSCKVKGRKCYAVPGSYKTCNSRKYVSKLNARIFREQTSSEKAIQRLTKEVQDLEMKKALERRVKEEIALENCRKKVTDNSSDFNTRLETRKHNKEKEICFSDELVAIRNDHEVETENLKKGQERILKRQSRSIKNNCGRRISKYAGRGSPLKHKVLDLENEVAACNNLLRQHQAKHEDW